MKTNLLLRWYAALLLALPYPAAAQAPAFDQAQTCGEWLTPGSEASACAVVADASGNTYVAGGYYGSVRFGTTTFTTNDDDAFVAKRDASGAWLWAVSGGGPAGDQINALVLDAQGGVYVAGLFASGTRGTPTTATFGSTVLTTAGEADVFVAKLNGADGTWQWAQRAGGGNSFSGANDVARALAYDGAGGLFVAGTFDGPVSRFGLTALYNAGIATGSTSRDVFVAHLNAATGTWNWAQRTGDGPAHDDVAALVSDGQGHAYMSIKPGGPLTLGTTALPYTRGSVLGKVDAAGQWAWAHTLEGSPGVNSGPNGEGFTTAAGLAWGGNGHLYVTGSFSGATARLGSFTLTNASGSYTDIRPSPPITYQRNDAFIGRLHTATGAWQWVQRTGGVDHEFLYGLLVRRNRLYVSGSFGPGGGMFGPATLPSSGQNDALVAALDTTGAWQWHIPVGGAGSESIWVTDTDVAGHLHVVGYASSSNPVSLPPLSLSSTWRSTFYFLARLSGGPCVLTRRIMV